MVYAEFLEVFARMADAKYAKDAKMVSGAGKSFRIVR